METNGKILHARLMSVLPHKRGKALAVSLDAALTRLDTKTSEDTRSQLIPELIRTFNTLSLDQQISWLEYRWDAVKDPRWLTSLRSVALPYKDYPELRVSDAHESLQLSGTALRRWYELDPDGARDAVLTEITRPKPRYDAKVLGFLPDKTLPDAQHEIAQHFMATENYELEGNLASLLFRYADSDVVPEVLGKVTEKVGKWACVPQENMLAYLLRTFPQTAEPLIERAIAARGPESTACRQSIFLEIGALQSDPLLEHLAMGSLSDPDPQVAGNAAAYLGRYGSAAAEQALWNRYEQWSREWTGREIELRFVHAGENSNIWQEGLGENLARALASGIGWLSDENKLRRIRALAVGPNITRNLDGELNAWLESPISIRCTLTGFPPLPLSCIVAQYELHSAAALDTKLAQFPHGTTFVWSPPNFSATTELEKTFREISEFSSQNGIQLLRAPNAPIGVN
jgi:hypothetical protein